MLRIPIADTSQIAVGRRTVAAAARAAGFGETDEARAALVATELAGNLVRHGRGGELLIGSAGEAAQGLDLLALDSGPGMADVAACLRDGYSTAGTPGTGLGAVSRLSEAFDLHSAPGAGTAVLARLWPRRLVPAPGAFRHGAVHLPKAGEEVCGDAWYCATGPDGAALIVADGLGHGPQAAVASQEAIRLFRRTPFAPPADLLGIIHAGLRPTRGAAVGIARLDQAAGQVSFSGIGNIAATLIAAGRTQRMVSLSGTAGHTARRLQTFQYDFVGPALLVLCSDGLATSWSLDRYPGLFGRDPLLVAGILYRDFTRGRDDVTVAVLKTMPR